jgi:hypothetical protein
MISCHIYGSNYFLALWFGVLMESKSVGEKMEIRRVAGNNFDWRNRNRIQK